MENKRPLRVAMIGQKHVPSREGGVDVVVEELTKKLVQNGIQVTLYNRGIKGRKKVKEFHGARVKYTLALGRGGIGIVTSYFFGCLSIALGKYDVVHCHAEGVPLFLGLLRLFRKKTVVTIHGLEWQRAKWKKNSFASRVLKRGEEKAARKADAVIVLSRNVQKYFLDTYGRETMFIPNGVNVPVPRDANLIISEYGLEKNEYLLYLSRIVPEKGLRYLVQAFKKTNTFKKLVVAGGFNDSPAFVEEIKKLAQEDRRIVFLGHVEGQKLEELFSNAYFYVLPSDLEGMPLSLLEAMSYGNCCLTSDIPECAEVVEKNAVTFKRGDVDDLLQKMEDLLNHPSLVDFYKKNASNFVINKFKWDDVASKTIDLYYNICAKDR